MVQQASDVCLTCSIFSVIHDTKIYLKKKTVEIILGDIKIPSYCALYLIYVNVVLDFSMTTVFTKQGIIFLHTNTERTSWYEYTFSLVSVRNRKSHQNTKNMAVYKTVIWSVRTLADARGQ